MQYIPELICAMIDASDARRLASGLEIVEGAAEGGDGDEDADDDGLRHGILHLQLPHEQRTAHDAN